MWCIKTLWNTLFLWNIFSFHCEKLPCIIKHTRNLFKLEGQGKNFPEKVVKIFIKIVFMRQYQVGREGNKYKLLYVIIYLRIIKGIET